MSQSLKLSSRPAIASLVQFPRPLRYLMLAVAANGLIWGGTLLKVLASPQVYVSQWSIIFLRGNPKAEIDIPNIGSASANKELTLQKSEVVQSNYEAIAKTETVLKAAAAKVGMKRGEFGKPSSEMAENTAIMEFQITGSSPEEAQKKAYAFHTAFLERLNQLRQQQAAEQEAGFEQSLSVTRQRLELAQRQLSDFKSRSGLVDDGQIDMLIANLEELRQQYVEFLAKQRDASTRSVALFQQLAVSPAQASAAFGLQSDPLFQKYLADHSAATVQTTALASQWGTNHPLVVRAAANQAAARSALQARGQQLLSGQPADATTLSHLNLGPEGTERADLFRLLLTTHAEQQGLTSRAREISHQMTSFEQRLATLVQRNSTLEALKRDMKIAQAIFTSTLGGLDASKMDLFGAYPPIGLVAEPSLQQESVRPAQPEILLHATLWSAGVTGVFLLLWFRKTASAKWLLRYWGFID